MIHWKKRLGAQDRRYAEAIAPAETALAFFQQINHAYWQAMNETYLAEAWFYLGDLAKAKQFAHQGLQREEVVENLVFKNFTR